MRFDLVVRNGTLVTPETAPFAGDVAVHDGRIAAILAPGTEGIEAGATIDAAGKHVFPGLIDAHVHFGFAEPVREYATETFYAAQGGFTSIVAFFLNNQSYEGVFERVVEQCSRLAHVDFGFHFTACAEAHIAELPILVEKYGMSSLKYFMNFKGEEGRYMGLDGTDDGFLHALLARAAELGGITAVIHPENIEIVNRMRTAFQAAGKSSLRDWCLSKPPLTEAENMVRAMYFAEQLGARIYFPHVSCALGLDETRRWRRRYADIFVETCPQYLTHTLDMEIGSIGKANPPFRTAADVEALWAGLADGTIDVVASDHVPRKKATKLKPLWQASQGFPGTATILPVLIEHGHHKRGLTLQRIAQLLCSNPARIFRLPNKGALRPGYDADITIVDLELTRAVDPARLGSHSDYSLYEGWSLRGWPSATIVRGTIVMADGVVTGAEGLGRYLPRLA
jgi:dihydropyrimidinase